MSSNINSLSIKEKLIITGRELFSKKGFSETSVGDIIKEVNTSKGSLYHHFKSKEHLFSYILEEDALKWERELNNKLNTSTTTLDKFYTLGQHSAETKARFPLLMINDEFLASAFSHTDINERLKNINQAYFNIFYNLIKEGRDEELFIEVDLDYLTIILQNLINNVDMRMELSHLKFDRDMLYKTAIDIFLKGALKN